MSYLRVEVKLLWTYIVPMTLQTVHFYLLIINLLPEGLKSLCDSVTWRRDHLSCSLL